MVRLVCVGIVVPLTFFLAVLLAYRGTRTIADLSSVASPAQQVDTYSTGREGRAAILLSVRFSTLAYPLTYNVGRKSAETESEARDLVQRIKEASRLKAYFSPEDPAPILYQLEADGSVLIDYQSKLTENRLGSGLFFALALLSAYAFRKGITAYKLAL